MRRALAALPIAALPIAALLLAGCSTPASDRPLVVVTTNILGDVVEQIVGEEAEVLTLMRPNADPHSFEISAQEAARIHSADLLVSNGMGLEEGLQQHLDGASVPTVVAADHVEALPYADGGADDPHFWTDPAQMAGVVDAIEDAVARMDGVDPSVVSATADAYRAELAELETHMDEVFAAIPDDRRVLVTNHHVFGYLAARFDFRIVGAIIPGGTTLASPSAADLRDLVDAIDEAGVPTIFAESSQPDRLATVLAAEAQVEVAVVELFTESLTDADGGAPDYLTMMRVNTERIATGLSS